REVHAVPLQPEDLGLPHAGLQGDADDGVEGLVLGLIARLEQPGFFMGLQPHDLALRLQLQLDHRHGGEHAPFPVARFSNVRSNARGRLIEAALSRAGFPASSLRRTETAASRLPLYVLMRAAVMSRSRVSPPKCSMRCLAIRWSSSRLFFRA